MKKFNGDMNSLTNLVRVMPHGEGHDAVEGEEGLRETLRLADPPFGEDRPQSRRDPRQQRLCFFALFSRMNRNIPIEIQSRIVTTAHFWQKTFARRFQHCARRYSLRASNPPFMISSASTNANRGYLTLIQKQYIKIYILMPMSVVKCYNKRERERVVPPQKFVEEIELQTSFPLRGDQLKRFPELGDDLIWREITEHSTRISKNITRAD